MPHAPRPDASHPSRALFAGEKPVPVLPACEHFAGSEKLIGKAAKDPGAGPTLALAESARGPAVAIGPGPGSGVVWRVLFDRKQTTAIARGENGGRTITYSNVVRDWHRLGAWTGAALTLPLEIAPELPGERVAVLVQTGDTGPIIGALAFDRPGR